MAANAQLRQAAADSAAQVSSAASAAAGELSGSVAKETKAVKELVVAVAKKMDKVTLALTLTLTLTLGGGYPGEAHCSRGKSGSGSLA